MADYRVYRRDAASFDGVTAETGTYVQTGRLFTTVAVGAVGIFSPAVLGRSNTASVVQVLPQGGVFAGGLVRANVAAFSRISVPITEEGSVPILLSAGESLVITAAAMTSAEIIVNDMNDSQCADWLTTQAWNMTANQAIAPVIPVVGNVTIDPWLGSPQAIVVALGTPASTITLPDPADLQAGAWCVIRNDSAAVQTVAPSAGTINGAGTIAAGAAAIIVRLSGTQYSMT